MAIGDGAKLLIAKDLEKLGGANQVQLWTRSTIWKRGRLARTTERYTLEDAYAIEAKCPDVLFVLSKNERMRPHLVSSQYGSQPSPHLEGVTANYALGMHWEVQFLVLRGAAIWKLRMLFKLCVSPKIVQIFGDCYGHLT